MPRSKKKNKSSLSSETHALNFFAEAGLLKLVKRSGWWVVGIQNPESVAEHSFRCAVIAYYLAHMEKLDPSKVVLMALFNDIHESRINDLHKMGHYYIDFKDAEKKVFKEQIQHLNANVKTHLRKLRDDYDTQHSKESILARDADILECLIQAKEYYDAGYTAAGNFFERAPEFLRTKSARKLWKKIKQWNSNSWWKDIVRFER